MNSKHDLQLFSQRLKKVREARGINRTQLANALGIRVNSVSHWEQGRGFPELATFFLLCDMLKVCPYYLAGKSNHQHEWSPPSEAVTLKYNEQIHRTIYDLHRDAIMRFYGRSMREFEAASGAANTEAGDG